MKTYMQLMNDQKDIVNSSYLLVVLTELQEHHFCADLDDV